jgi:hypothetical protein
MIVRYETIVATVGKGEDVESRITSIEIKNNGKHATVSGPIDGWDADEVSATFATAITELTPTGGIVLAAGENSTPVNNGATTWSVDVAVLGNGQLTAPGIAMAWASASVKDDTNQYEPYPWAVPNVAVTAASVVGVH